MLPGEGQCLFSTQRDRLGNEQAVLITTTGSEARQMLGEFPDSGQREIGMGYTGRPAELPQPPVGLRAAP